MPPLASFRQRPGDIKRIDPSKCGNKPGQLVGHRLGRHHAMGPGLLSLVEALDPGAEPQGKVRRFDKGPGQIFVPVLGVALAFFLSIADFLTADTAA